MNNLVKNIMIYFLVVFLGTRKIDDDNNKIIMIIVIIIILIIYLLLVTKPCVVFISLFFVI